MDILKISKEFNINELNAILNALPDGLVIYDKEGKQVYFNEASKKIFESHQVNENINLNLKERVKMANFYTLDGKLITPEDSPIYKALNCGQITRDFIVMSSDASNSPIYTSTNAAPILDDNGEIIGAVGTHTDITEIKRNELRVAFQAHLLESAHDAIVAVNENYIITYWNDMAEKMFGWTAEEVMGQSSEGIFKIIVPNSTRDSLINIIQKDGVYAGEVIYHHKDGREIYADIHTKIIRDKDGKFKGNVTCFRDITERKKAEAALNESEQLYRKLFDNSQDGFALCEAIYDNDGKLVDGMVKKVNRAFEENTGIPSAAIVGKRGSEIDPDANQEWLTFEDKVLKTGEPVRFEQYIHDTGQYYEIYIFPHSRNTFGKLFRDITERKLAEKNLKENRELLNAIIQAQAVGVSVLKSIRDDNGKIIDFKYTFANNIRKKMANGLELEGMTIQQMFPDAEVQRVLDMYREIVETGKPLDCEVTCKHLGYEGFLRVNAVKFGDGVVANVESVTERKRAQQELIQAKEELAKRAEDRYVKLFNSIDEGLCIGEVIFEDAGKPADFRIIESNPAYAAFASQTGFHNVEGRFISEAHHYANEQWLKAISKVALTGEPFRFELEIKRSKRWFSIYVFKTDTANKCNAAVLFKDVTSEVSERKELEEALKMQEQVFANVSHELKTPLNVIFSTTQLMELFFNNDSLDANKDKISKGINIIKQNCYRFTKLINNIVDLSKIEGGFSKLELSNENIVEVTEDIVQSVSDYIKEKGISITFDTNTEERIIAVDADKIERIILNLISNAVKFTNPGGSIFVKLTDKNDSVEISVQDTGIGMEKEHLNMIFKRFHQVDKSLSRNAEGSGIGLSLVKSIVDLHSGKISADSEPGKGSTFKIEFPVRTIKVDSVDSIVKAKPINNKIEKINIEFSDIYSKC